MNMLTYINSQYLGIALYRGIPLPLLSLAGVSESDSNCWTKKQHRQEDTNTERIATH